MALHSRGLCTDEGDDVDKATRTIPYLLYSTIATKSQISLSYPHFVKLVSGFHCGCKPAFCDAGALAPNVHPVKVTVTASPLPSSETRGPSASGWPSLCQKVRLPLRRACSHLPRTPVACLTEAKPTPHRLAQIKGHPFNWPVPKVSQAQHDSATLQATGVFHNRCFVGSCADLAICQEMCPVVGLAHCKQSREIFRTFQVRHLAFAIQGHKHVHSHGKLRLLSAVLRSMTIIRD